MPARCPVFLLEVALSTGGNATNITVKGSNWGEIFIYDDEEKSWVISSNLILGVHTGINGSSGIGIGAFSGLNSQSIYAIAIGRDAGNIFQHESAIALGKNAGYQSQQTNAIAIGLNSGQTNQQANSIAIGVTSGQTNQQAISIAIGTNSGKVLQQTKSIAIGPNSGQTNQQANSIALGVNTSNQGVNSVAIGANTIASTSQIVIDASFSTPLTGISGLFLRPVRGPLSGAGFISYDTTTKEVIYNGSSERYKYDIRDLTDSSVTGLQPREFKYKLNDAPDIGLIAEEAFQCDPSFAYLDNQQIPEGIQWNAITVSLVLELKRLKVRKEALLTKIRSSM